MGENESPKKIVTIYWSYSMSERNCAEYSKAAHEFSALEEESYHQMSRTGSEEETMLKQKWAQS